VNEWRVHRYSYGSQHTCFVLEYFRLYNTRARRIFPNHTYKEAPDFRRPLSQFRKIRTYSGNNLTPGVSCPRLQEHGAPSTGMRSQGFTQWSSGCAFLFRPRDHCRPARGIRSDSREFASELRTLPVKCGRMRRHAIASFVLELTVPRCEYRGHHRNVPTPSLIFRHANAAIGLDWKCACGICAAMILDPYGERFQSWEWIVGPRVSPPDGC